MKTIKVFSGLVFLLVMQTSFAQSVGVDYDNKVSGGCVGVNIVNNLRLRSADSGSNYEVTTLQKFLFQNKYLEISPTGYFGSKTKAAVTQFQKDQGLIGTGFVGPYTRAMLKNFSCDSNVDDNNNSNTITSSSSVSSAALAPATQIDYILDNIGGNNFIQVTTKNLIKNIPLKWCIKQPGDLSKKCSNLILGTYEAAGFADFRESDWITSSTTKFTIPVPNRDNMVKQEFYIIYPGKTQVIRTDSLAPSSLNQTQTTSSSPQWSISANPNSGYVLNGTLNNTGTIYTRTTGLVKSLSPKGCAKPLGSSGCTDASGFRDFTSEEWINDTTIQETIQSGAYPSNTYESFILYAGKPIIKAGTLTLKSVVKNYGWACFVVGPAPTGGDWDCNAANLGKSYPADRSCFCKER